MKQIEITPISCVNCPFRDVENDSCRLTYMQDDLKHVESISYHFLPEDCPLNEYTVTVKK